MSDSLESVRLTRLCVLPAFHCQLLVETDSGQRSLFRAHSTTNVKFTKFMFHGITVSIAGLLCMVKCKDPRILQQCGGWSCGKPNSHDLNSTLATLHSSVPVFLSTAPPLKLKHITDWRLSVYDTILELQGEILSNEILECSGDPEV